MKYLVLLAGCGLGDGSCIEEVILTYVALDKYGCDYTPVAEDVSMQSVNHLTEQIAEKRNILIEAARIGRGRIKDIHEVDFAEYDIRSKGYDGIEYGSTMRKQGFNLAVFDPTLFKCTSTKVYDVKSISYDYKPI